MRIQGMPPYRPLASAARSGVSVGGRSRPAPVRSPSPPGLRVMVAGVDKDERGAVEASVRQALGSRAEGGPWSISVVSMAGKWSVTLDGPEERLRGLSFVADGSRLADAIREAVHGQAGTPGDGGLAPTTAASATVVPPAATALASDAGDRYVCKHCGNTVLVIYEERPGDGKAVAAVACPHCWQIGHVEIGAWAAAGGEYRAEKG